MDTNAVRALDRMFNELLMHAAAGDIPRRHENEAPTLVDPGDEPPPRKDDGVLGFQDGRARLRLACRVPSRGLPHPVHRATCSRPKTADLGGQWSVDWRPNGSVASAAR